MKLFYVSLILFVTSELSLGYKILALFPVQASSHYAMYGRLLKRLAEKGHEVDVLSHFPQKKEIPRLNDLSVAGSMPDFINNVSISFVKNLSFVESLKDIIILSGVETCEIIFNTAAAKNLKKEKKIYDLVITEIFGSDCMLGFAHLFKVPTISVMSSVSLPWANDRIGNPDNPSYVPNYFLLYSSKMSLSERLINTFALITSKLLYYFYSIRDSNRISRQFFGGDLPDLEELVKNTSLILVNSHFSINQARPAVPNFIEVGGLHIGEIKPLSKRISSIIEKGYKGLIYLSMGSMIMTETFDVQKLQALFDAFAQLPYIVLWKANTTKFPNNLVYAKNIHFEPWLPQLDILCHPKTKLFVTHGGLMGVQEAIYCGVPQLGIPLFADQELNIRQSIEMGIAQKVAYDNISKISILNAAANLLDNERVGENAKKISAIFKDRPVSALDTATYWVEYVIRHKGALHLRSRGADLPWYQYFLIDIALLSIIMLVVLLISLVLIVKAASKICISSKRKDKIKFN